MTIQPLTYAEWRERQPFGTPIPADQCRACGHQLDEQGQCRRCLREKKR